KRTRLDPEIRCLSQVCPTGLPHRFCPQANYCGGLLSCKRWYVNPTLAAAAAGEQPAGPRPAPHQDFVEPGSGEPQLLPRSDSAELGSAARPSQKSSTRTNSNSRIRYSCSEFHLRERRFAKQRLLQRASGPCADRRKIPKANSRSDR